jgi:hypothetical protein
MGDGKLIETFIAGTALALACFWMWKYGHIVVAVGLVLAAIAGVYGVAEGMIQGSTVFLGAAVLGIIGVFAVM